VDASITQGTLTMTFMPFGGRALPATASSRNVVLDGAVCDSAVKESTNVSRRTLQAFRNGIGKKVTGVIRGKAQHIGCHWWYHRRWQCDAMVGRGVFRGMQIRCSGIAVMPCCLCAILMVADAGEVSHILCDSTRTCGGIPAALHCEAMQGQQHHQEKAKISTHRNWFLRNWRGL
jgi:hypothetical protein